MLGSDVGQAACAVGGCDQRLARRLWRVAAAGAGPDPWRTADGRRASCLTPSGAPLELNATGGADADPVLRWTTEAGTALPFFAPRLAAQRSAWANLARCLGVAPDSVLEVADLVAPDPSAVPARTLLGTLTGVVLGAAGFERLKAYGNAALPGAPARWRAAWPDVAEAVEDLAAAGLVDHLVCAEVDAGGRRTKKAYLRTAAPTTPEAITATLGVELPDELAPSLRRKPAHVCRAVGPDGERTTTVHVDVATAGGEPVARALVGAWTGGEGVVDAVVRAATAAGGRWRVTMAGIRLDRPRANVYAEPMVAT